MAGSADTLFMPIENGEVPLGDGKWFYLGAKAIEGGFSDDLRAALVCEQSMRGPYMDLQMRGMDVHPSVESSTLFSGALILIGKHRAENEAMVARASTMVASGAPILIAGDKTSGVVPLRKRMSSFVDVDGSLAKFHATVFWLRNSAEIATNLNSNKASPEGFKTSGGMFSAGKIDKGSALLAEHLDDSIRGDIADFGAGWGYLSAELLSRFNPRTVHLYEAHWASLEAAKENLSSYDQGQISYYWHDLAREPVGKKFDWIIMNPPFHTARKTEPQLGVQFIETAAKSLKPKGALLMVANVALPYEKALQQHFTKVTQLDRRDGFKLLKALR
ncbi:class I SAM-dependent methyltransferase [Ahrensia kielensis]|uniref:class I SAM-dependent methyltransferase n=1 Tax=Ahrensia kielensis TaxID=76980 RepID=UPI00037FAA8C|nr:class I SAM-dependent methyltransferase [Ahrensia kielensis]